MNLSKQQNLNKTLNLPVVTHWGRPQHQRVKLCREPDHRHRCTRSADQEPREQWIKVVLHKKERAASEQSHFGLFTVWSPIKINHVYCCFAAKVPKCTVIKNMMGSTLPFGSSHQSQHISQTSLSPYFSERPPSNSPSYSLIFHVWQSDVFSRNHLAHSGSPGDGVPGMWTIQSVWSKRADQRQYDAAPLPPVLTYS